MLCLPSVTSESRTSLILELSNLLTPGEMGEMRVGGAGDHRAAHRLELRHPVGEGDDLGRAHKGEVQWVEEEDHVPP